MNSPVIPIPPRIIVIDDNPAIHEDFRKILCPAPTDDGLDELEADIFDEERSEQGRYQPEEFDLVTALQGKEGFEKILAARKEERPFSLAFVDGRMPPGWDGVETIQRIWKEVPELQVVFCTAYSDYSWNEVLSRIGGTDNLIILKKPFDTVEVAQLARTLTQKWALTQRVQFQTANLHRMVEIRTEEIRRINHELVRTNDDLSRALGVRDGIITSITHELRTPINGIVGSAELLGTAVTTEEDKDNLRTIMECAQMLTGQVDNLVAIAENRGGDRLAGARLRLADIVSEAVDAHRAVASAKGLFIRQQLAPEIPEEIPGDPAELRQVLLGLLSNATKFTERGLVSVSGSLESGGAIVRLEVRDTGVGIAADDIVDLFEPFHGGDRSFSRRQGGLGLGLAVGRRLVRHMSGTLSCTSEIGKGTTFVVRLPANPGVEVGSD
jgi:two-component system, sensor histidine kinase and response regulator